MLIMMLDIIYNNGGNSEWLFGQKSITRNDFTFSRLISGVETDYLTISTNGNIGISTTVTSYTLDINGTSRIPRHPFPKLHSQFTLYIK